MIDLFGWRLMSPMDIRKQDRLKRVHINQAHARGYDEGYDAGYEEAIDDLEDDATPCDCENCNPMVVSVAEKIAVVERAVTSAMALNIATAEALFGDVNFNQFTIPPDFFNKIPMRVG